LKRMRQAARRTFAQRYAASANHDLLMTIYQRAIGARHEQVLRSATSAR
jgi:hypothetical protein